MDDGGVENDERRDALAELLSIEELDPSTGSEGGCPSDVVGPRLTLNPISKKKENIRAYRWFDGSMGFGSGTGLFPSHYCV